jgi:hypothetical protein
MKKVRARIERNLFRERALNGQISVSGLFETDDDIIKMRQTYSQEFFDTFRTGIEYYINGDWVQAKIELDKVEVCVSSQCSDC